MVLELLQYYKWFRATILVEAKAIATFYRDVGNLIVDQIKQRPQRLKALFEVEQYTVDTTGPDEMLDAALLLAKRRSRGNKIIQKTVHQKYELKTAESISKRMQSLNEICLQRFCCWPLDKQL